MSRCRVVLRKDAAMFRRSSDISCSLNDKSITSSYMDPSLSSTSEPSIPPHDSDTIPRPSYYTGQNYLASQSLADFLQVGSIQESEVNVGPPSHPPPHPYTHPPEIAHRLIPVYTGMPNIPRRQGQSNQQQPASLPGEVPPSQMRFRTTPTQLGDTSWRATQRQITQAEIAAQNPLTLPQWPYNVGVPWPPALMELPSTKPSGVPERAHVESVSPEASTRPSKKRRDMLRKRDQRADDIQHFARICDLLKIPLGPKKTLTRRILSGVEEMVKQRKLDDALRRRLEVGETDFAVLRGELTQDSNDTAPGGSDIGATPSIGLCPKGGRDADEGHD